MPLSTITASVQDSVKIMDYADPRTYHFTAVLTEPTEKELGEAVAMMRKHGEAFLKGAEVKVQVKTKGADTPTAETPASPPSPPAPPVEDPLEPKAPVEQPADDPLTGAAAAPITDDDIVHAVMKKNEALKNATPIRALVETYNPQPGLRVFKATEIEQKDRAGFLVKLEALTV